MQIYYTQEYSVLDIADDICFVLILTMITGTKNKELKPDHNFYQRN